MKLSCLFTRNKRPLFLTLLLSIVCSHLYADQWNGSAISAPALSGTTYTIASCANLAWLAQQVNGGNTYSGFTFVVTSNLDLNNKSWTPIGNSSSTTFQGTFDGGGYTISNMTSTFGWWPISATAGLFGYVTNPAVIQNVILSNITTFNYCNGSSIMGVGGLVFSAQGSSGNLVFLTNCSVTSGTITAGSSNPVSPAAAIATYASYATITNCSSYATISSSNYTAGIVAQASNVIFTGCSAYGSINNTNTSAGGAGIAAYTSGTTSLSNCSSSATITGSNYTGGIIGSLNSTGTIQNCTSSSSLSASSDYIGGLIGIVQNTAKIRQCSYNGSLTIGNISYAGGLIGCITANATIDTCSFTGYYSGGNQYIGGIAGGVTASTTFRGCYSTGNINQGSFNLGGFVGYINGGSPTFTNCYTTGRITSGSTPVGGFVGEIDNSTTLATFTGCYATGFVITTNSYTGGFVGTINGACNITNCYSTGNVNSNNTPAGGFVAAITGGGTVNIANSFESGRVASRSAVGGFIGIISNTFPTYIVNCYATGSVQPYNMNSTNPGGGFAGTVNSYTHIENCFATGSVYGFPASWGGGGFVGNGGSSNTFVNCYYDLQGTGITQASGSGSSAGITGVSTTTMTSTAFSSYLLNNSTYGTNTWTFNNGYYPELTSLKSGTSTYTITSPTSIAISASTPTDDQKAWSSLSVVPLFFNIPNNDNSSNVSTNITAPMYSSASVSNSVWWAGSPQSFDQGLLSFNNDASGTMVPAQKGTYTFTTTDANGRTKSFFVYINKTRVYFVRDNTKYSSASDSNDGTTWTTAFATVQKGVEAANTQTPKYMVWVAAGNYNRNSAYSSTTGYQVGSSWSGWGVNFLMREGVNVYGSFKEFGNSYPNNNNAGMDTRLANGTSILNGSSSNLVLAPLYSAVGSGFSTATTWDGFTVTGGIADTDSTHYAVTVPGNASIRNFILQGNNGAALDLLSGAQAINALVTDNNGRAIAMDGNAILTNATVANNTYGTAIYATGTTPTINNSIFWKNKKIISGTATFNSSSASSYYGSDPWPSSGGDGKNIDLGHRSPNFKASNNYQLLLISPCLSAGKTTYNPSGTDILNQTRTCGCGSTSIIDMGAYQKWDGITISGDYNSYSIKNLRKGSLVPLSNLTVSNDTAEVLITQGTKFDMGGNTNLKAKWLEIKDSTVVTSSLNPPIITNGSITADNALYVRSFPLFVYKNGNYSTTTHAWSFFGLPYPVSSLNKIDGAIVQSSVLIQQYSESERAADGPDKSAWGGLGLTSSASLSVGTGYSVNLNSTRLPYNRTVIFPSNGSITLPTTTGNIDITGLTYTTSGSLLWTERGWNFISNPYPQTAYINSPSSDNTYWPNGTTTDVSLYPGGVYMYNSNSDSYTIYTLSDFNSNGLLPYGACFIKTGNTTNAKVRFSIMANTTTALRAKSFVAATTSAASAVQFRFDIAGDNTSSHTYVIFHPAASASIVESEDYPNWSSTSNGNNIVMSTFASGSTVALGINTLPFTGPSMEIPLQVSVPTTDNYTISLPDKYKSDSTIVYLKDTSGSLTNLNSTSYTFQVADSSSVADFTLVFMKNTGFISKSTINDITMIQNKSNVTLYNSNTIQQILVYSPTGQLCSQKEVTGYEASFDLPTMPGVYLVKVITNKGSVTKKIINP